MEQYKISPQKIISTLILTELEEVGPMGAQWSEMDSYAGYLIRQDGKMHGIGEYQADSNDLKHCSRSELGSIWGNLVAWQSLEKRFAVPFSHSIVQWLLGHTDKVLPGAYLVYFGDYSTYNFNIECDIIKDIIWRGQDSTQHILHKGGKINIWLNEHYVSNDLYAIAPDSEYGILLKIPAEYLEFNITNNQYNDDKLDLDAINELNDSQMDLEILNMSDFSQSDLGTIKKKKKNRSLTKEKKLKKDI